MKRAVGLFLKPRRYEGAKDMELNEFVKQALVQVIEGVRDAQAVEGKEFVNPRIINPAPSGRIREKVNGQLVHDVSFDVAITTEDSSGSKAGGKISVLGLNAGADIDENLLSRTVSRIKFTVPIAYPLS